MITWVERSPKHGEMVKIIWADWFADIIGQRTTVGVYDMFHSTQGYSIDIGDRWIILDHYANIEVAEVN